MRNVDKRKKFIEAFGKEKFLELAKTDERYKKLLSIKLPDECQWLWRHFQRIWRDAERDMNGYPIITPQTVLVYMEYYCVNFDVKQRELIMQMKLWAIETIAELRKKKES